MDGVEQDKRPRAQRLPNRPALLVVHDDGGLTGKAELNRGGGIKTYKGNTGIVADFLYFR